MVQQQLYATMPKYVIRMAGETAKPGWIANVNPFVVVCCVSFITRWMARRTAITSMNIGMFLIPVSALLMACGNLLGNEIISGMSNITLMMILGIVVQALAECFISPRYLEYFSLQAPEGEERHVSRIQPSPFFPVLYFRFWHSGCIAYQILSRPGFICNPGSLGSCQRQCALHLVLLCGNRIGGCHSVADFCQNHRIHRQKEESIIFYIAYFRYICRPMQRQVASGIN